MTLHPYTRTGRLALYTIIIVGGLIFNHHHGGRIGADSDSTEMDAVHSKSRGWTKCLMTGCLLEDGEDGTVHWWHNYVNVFTGRG